MTPIDPRLEAEYNNRVKVPDHPAIMAGWKRDAATFRDTHPHSELGLAYGEGERLAMDVFWPGPHRDAPMAMFIHGGYWAALDRSWFSHLANGFVSNGIALAIPSYDLCPHVTIGTIIEQVRDAAGFLVGRHGGDVYATGHSAGGHLTAMLLATDWASRGTRVGRVSGGCAISGLFDLVPLVATTINGPLGLDAASAASLSPMDLPAPGLLLHAYVGEHEGQEYLRQTQSIAAAWNGKWHVVADANHFTAIAPLANGDSAMMKTIVSAMGRGESA